MVKFMIFSLNILFLSLVIAEVPSYIPICGRRNPNLDECVKKSVEAIRPKLSTGIPELDVPSIDPLLLTHPVPLTSLNDFKAAATNVKVYNAPSFTINSVHVDLENQKIDVAVHFDKMRLVGDYEVAAKVVVPIEAKGTIDLDVEGIDSQSTMTYTLRDTKKGKQMFFTGMTTKLKIKDYKSRFIAHEGPEATFSDAINAVINTNRREIADSITPSLETAVSSDILRISNKITKNFTYDELFPDRE